MWTRSAGTEHSLDGTPRGMKNALLKHEAAKHHSQPDVRIIVGCKMTDDEHGRKTMLRHLRCMMHVQDGMIIMSCPSLFFFIFG